MRTSWAAALPAGAVAAGAAIAGMFWARSVFQIRTLPERVIEWILIFVPLDLFEKVLGILGPRAKVVATYATVAGLFLILLGLGLIALRRGWPAWLVLALGPLLWLFAMVVVMPVTGAGFFARDLFQDVPLINATYLAIGLGYACLLLLGRVLAGALTARLVVRTAGAGVAEVAVAATWDAAGPDRGIGRTADRRAFLLGIGGTAVAYAATSWLGRTAGTSTSSLPLAQVEPAAPAAPAASPTPVTAVSAAGGALAGPTATAAPAASPTTDLPEPPPARRLDRDKDGALAGAARPKGELAPVITANEAFYTVTKNAVQDPIIRPDAWRLTIDGEVARPVQIDYRGLRRLPSAETYKTFECISNFTAQCQLTAFGCDLISNAKWRGVRLKDLIDLAGGPKPGAVEAAIVSADEFSSAIPLEAALDPGTLLVYEMNGEVLPREHGYPARLLIPGRYGMKNPKWVVAIRLVSRHFTGYYEQRNWDEAGVVKTMTRIDVPAFGATLPPGRHRIAGIAYGGKRGISRVEYSADDKATWREARLLEPPLGQDTWVRWEGDFDLAPGAGLKLWSRATDGEGTLQIETFSLPQPSGGAGWCSVDVKSA